MATNDWSGVHPQAIVDPSAKLADNVTVGPWSYIGPGVEIGEGTEQNSLSLPTTLSRGTAGEPQTSERILYHIEVKTLNADACLGTRTNNAWSLVDNSLTLLRG